MDSRSRVIIFASYALVFFFSMNIGASGTAASMAAPYGGGAIDGRKATLLVALFSFLGSILGGAPVVNTVGSGILQQAPLALPVALVVLLAASVTLFTANLLRIPLSTSEVTVGALVGVGLVVGGLNFQRVLGVLAAWVAVPLLAFGISYGLSRWVAPPLGELLSRSQPQGRRVAPLRALLIAAGCYEAFAAGANNVANAVGPLVGAGMLTATQASVAGGLLVACGAVVLGGRVLETAGKKITRMSAVQGVLVSVTSGSLVIAASLWGLPVPLTQATTCAIMGTGYGRRGKEGVNGSTLRAIARVWVISPIASLVIASLLMMMALEPPGLQPRVAAEEAVRAEETVRPETQANPAPPLELPGALRARAPVPPCRRQR